MGKEHENVVVSCDFFPIAQLRLNISNKVREKCSGQESNLAPSAN